MNNKLLRMSWPLMCMAAFLLATGFVSCNKEPDESNLYTLTGESIESFIQKDSDLTSFNYILQRVGMDRTAAAYGQYTCFAPSNAGVAEYIDSLWNDPEAVIPNNGMTENSLEGLSDSLCLELAKYHFTNGLYSIIDMGGVGATISTMLGRSISSSVDSLGRTVLNNVSIITSEDNEVINGLVHKCTKVIPRSTLMLGATLERLEDYTIFTEALKKTGLIDSILLTKKDKTWTEMSDHTDTNGAVLYFPQECNIGYTIFAETNAVMRQNGINSFDDLVAYANRIYGDAASWYDYPREQGISISQGSDYTNRFNCLNMFIAYHILYASMAQDQLVDESSVNSYWNYTNGGEPYDYYETMLPGTLLKIWEPQPGKTLYLNRWKLNNTLTDEVGTYGSEAMHPIQQAGIIISRQGVQAYNGYVHPIRGMLVYDRNVPKGVLNERMRIETTSFLPEFCTNGFRYNSISEVSAMNGGGSGARIAFPNDYFDHVKVYTTEDLTKIRYNVRGAYNSWQADCFQGWGSGYDFSVKLPPVPSGLYELRINMVPMSHGGMMQFYVGTSSNLQDMVAVGIPFDARILADDERVGWTDWEEEEDQGIASDAALRNRNYMRGPHSFRCHPENGDGWSCRGRNQGNTTMRLILTRQNFRQSQEYWLRIKTVIDDDPDLKWQLDYVEFVPVTIPDNQVYAEDWF